MHNKREASTAGCWKKEVGFPHNTAKSEKRDTHTKGRAKNSHFLKPAILISKENPCWHKTHPIHIKRQSSCHASTTRKILNAEYHELGIIWFESHIDIRPSAASNDPDATASRQIFHNLLRPSPNQQQEKILVLWSIAKSRISHDGRDPTKSLERS